MTILSRSGRDPAMATVQCDVCCPPAQATNDLAVLRSVGWRLAVDGDEHDACAACARDRRDRDGGLRGDRDPGTATGGRWPNLVVIGAAKCGTTSLHAHLDTHPEIAMADLKELRYFTDPGAASWTDWYCAQFDPEAPVVGESSTMYTRSPALPGVAARMWAAVPEARLVYLVRDPVERALASYTEERFQLLDPRPVDAAFADLDDPYNPYLAASRYAEQAEEFLSFYPRGQLLVLSLSDLQHRPDDTMRRVFEHAGVDPGHQVDASTRHNEATAKYEYGDVAARLRRGVAGRLVHRLPPRARTTVQAAARRVLSRPMDRPEPSPELQARIAAALEPDATRFRALTGLPFDDWSV